MLVAYGPDGDPVVAEETPLAQLQDWSHGHLLHCPNCRGVVHLRGGRDKRTQLHFAHQKGECAWSTETESVRHATGKVVLARWLQQQFPTASVTLEERLPEPNRIADVFVSHADGRRQAIEFQCAPLDIAEWTMRHKAYRSAGIIDTWIIGINRREKQEAFIEAILTQAHEALFLDPLVTPPRIWLRWPISRHQALAWQDKQVAASGDSDAGMYGWVGRSGFGMTVTGTLSQVRFSPQARLLHPARAVLETRSRLLQNMQTAELPDEETLRLYLAERVAEKALQTVLLPLLRAYLHDPDLLRRYNYGRGLVDQPLSAGDQQRVQKAQSWLTGLIQYGYTPQDIAALIKLIPFVGCYAAFATYAEALLALVQA